jgi:tetratricopeptide (TPR) repeat protein
VESAATTVNVLRWFRRAGALASARFVLFGLIALLAQPVQADEKDDVRRMQAQQLANDGQCEQALVTLGDPSRDDPRSGLLRGQCQIRLRRYGEALDTLDAVKREQPDLPGLELERGIALYHLGDLDRARGALADARAAGSGDDPRLDLYEGLLHLQGAELEEAAIALERARTLGGRGVDPVASFYAGVAWAGLRERERAEESLRRVIEEDPDGPWADEARELLAGRTRKPEAGKPWFLVRGGMEYDSNVVLTRNATLAPEISEKDSWLGVWYAELGSELFREGAWSGGALVSYEGNAHVEEDLQDFNTHYPVASGWLDYQIDRNHRARLRYDVGYAAVDEKDYYWGQDVTLSGLRYWGAPGETELFVGFDHDDYLFDLRNNKFEDADGDPVRLGGNVRDLDRDGVGVSGGFRHFMPLLDGDVVARTGYTVERFWADGSEYDGIAHEFMVGYVATLPFEVVWDTEARFRYEPFSNRSIFPIDTDPGPDGQRVPTNPSDDRSRLDKTWDFETVLSKAITERVSVQASYSYTDADSNVPDYSYERHIVGGYVTIRLY